jgi:hypothetical protein
VVLAIAAGGAAFAISREVAPDSSVSADDPVYGSTPPKGNATPFGFVPAEKTRAAKPLSDVVINGISVGPNSVRTGGPCEGIPNDSAEINERPYSDARNTLLAIEPKYLPSGTREEPNLRNVAVFCRGEIAGTQRTYSVPADPNLPRFGGSLSILRSKGERAARISLPADDFSPGAIAGRPAVLIRPTTPEGVGSSAIVIAEDFGVTVLQASGLRLEELIRVAEGLY